MEEKQFWTARHNERGYIVEILGTSKDMEDVLSGYYDRSEARWSEYTNYSAWRKTVNCKTEPVCPKCLGEMEKIVSKKCKDCGATGKIKSKSCNTCYGSGKAVTYKDCPVCDGTGKRKF
jgi:RecJ-like exonuclease